MYELCTTIRSQFDGQAFLASFQVPRLLQPSFHVLGIPFGPLSPRLDPHPAPVPAALNIADLCFCSEFSSLGLSSHPLQSPSPR